MPYPSERFTNEPLPDKNTGSFYEDEVKPRRRDVARENEEAAEQDKAFRELSDSELRGGTVNAVRYSPTVRTRDPKKLSNEDINTFDLDAARAARDAKNAAIHEETNKNALSLRTEPNAHEAGMIKAHVEKFKRLPAGPEKEKARASAHSIVQGTHRRGSQTTSQYILPYGQEMPCATPGCQNIVPYDTKPGVKGAKPPKDAKVKPGRRGSTGNINTVIDENTGTEYGHWGSVASNVGGGDVTCPGGKCNLAHSPSVQRPAER